jgi:parallel beta-helix repeat protein
MLVIAAAGLLGLGLVDCGGGGGGRAPVVAAVPVPACVAPAPTSSRTASVKDPAYGARGDGVSDDTAAIQKAVNALAGSGGTLSFPGGTYMVNAVPGILVQGGLTLQLAADAVLAVIPNAAQNYSVLTVAGTGVNILGGTIQGDYGSHLGTGGEWGMGITLAGARNVLILGVTSLNCWGDGFYVGSGSSGVTLCSVTALHNRRNGLSLTSANSVTVLHSTFMNSGGTLPEDGLDIEPNPGETVSNVAITGCTFTGNAGDGIEDGVDLSATGSAFITQVTLTGNTITGNGAGSLDPDPRNGIELSNCSGQQVTDNLVSGNTGNGIQLRNGATGMTITGNTIQNNTLHGIWDTAGGNDVSANLVSGNGLTP